MSRRSHSPPSRAQSGPTCPTLADQPKAAAAIDTAPERPNCTASRAALPLRQCNGKIAGMRPILVVILCLAIATVGVLAVAVRLGTRW
jgi:hypothetical protein